MTTITKNYSLSNSNIDAIASDVEAWLAQAKIQPDHALRLKLSIEEMLLRWQDHFGEDADVALNIGKRLGHLYINFSLQGEAFDPRSIADDDQEWISRVLSEVGLEPSYSYKRGANHIYIRYKQRKLSPIVKLLVAAALAVVLGLAGFNLFPAQAEGIATMLLSPLQDTLLGLLTAAAVPMIFLSVLLGVSGVGDAEVFKRIGGTLLRRFFLKMLLLTVIVTVAMYPFFSLNMGGNSLQADQFIGAVEMLFGILPSSMVEPFVTGNTLQIIVIAVAFGLAILVLGSRANLIKKFMQELNFSIHIIFDWIFELLPLLVFTLLLKIIWMGDLKMLISLWKPVLIALIITVFYSLGTLLLLSQKLRVSPAALLKKMSPALLIAITTSSSTATFGSNVASCKHNFGIDSKLTDFGVPMGTVAFKPSIAAFFMLFAYFSAELYNVPCSIAWIFIACISSILLAVSLPPVPGGAMAVYSILFSQLGIPSEAIIFALAADVITDRLAVLVNMLMLQAELALTASQLDLMDKTILHSDTAVSAAAK